MALETNLADVATCEHAWIRRSVRLMATEAGLHPNGCMLEGKGPALVGVAFETGDILSADETHVGRRPRTMRIMTVRTMDGSARQLVGERPLKAGADSRMTA